MMLECRIFEVQINKKEFFEEAMFLCSYNIFKNGQYCVCLAFNKF